MPYEGGDDEGLPFLKLTANAPENGPSQNSRVVKGGGSKGRGFPNIPYCSLIINGNLGGGFKYFLFSPLFGGRFPF